MNKYLKICFFSVLALVNGKNISDSRRNDASDTDTINSVGEDLGTSESDNSDVHGTVELTLAQKDVHNCWMSLDSKQHFKAMDEIDEHYRQVRSSYQKQVGEELDKKMLETMLEVRGIAEREIHKTRGVVDLIPAGLNLGGYSMMRMKDSVIFFHRMKLRNDTRFRVNFLHNDLVDMTLTVRLSLHDLHLVGAYERSPTDKDPSILFYAPSYGEVEFLLKNVNYKMEGRLRLLKDRLIIELVISELIIEDIIMTYLSKDLAEKPIKLQKEHLEDFLERMKTDLDKWLIDYFNDYLMFSTTVDSANQGFLQAEKDKMIVLNEFADGAIQKIKNKISQIGANIIKIPNFSIFGAQRMLIRLKDGYLRGLGSLYRRSVVTGKREKKIRKVDLIVGFSNLKVAYRYEAVLSSETPPLTGLLILSADELTAHMGLSLVKDPEMVDMDFDFIQQMKPESLTVEGPANRMIANFKHLLEHHIIAIMSNTLIHSIKALKSLPKCEPFLFKYNEPKDKHNQYSDQSDVIQVSPDNDASVREAPMSHKHETSNDNSQNMADTQNPFTHRISEYTLPAPTVPIRTFGNKDKNIGRQYPIRKYKKVVRKKFTGKFKVRVGKNATLSYKQK